MIMTFSINKFSRNLLLIGISFCSVVYLSLFTNQLVFAEAIPQKIATQDINQEEIKLIQALLSKSLKAAEAEDIEAGMAMVHPDSPFVEEMRIISEELMKRYDLDFEYNELEIIELSESEGKIKITQTTKKISGSEDFRNNRTVAIQALKKYNGQWKFFDLPQIIDVQYLN